MLPPNDRQVTYASTIFPAFLPWADLCSPHDSSILYVGPPVTNARFFKLERNYTSSFQSDLIFILNAHAIHASTHQQTPSCNHQTSKVDTARLPMSVHILRKIPAPFPKSRRLIKIIFRANMSAWWIARKSSYFYFLIETTASCALLGLHSLWIWNSIP